MTFYSESVGIFEPLWIMGSGYRQGLEKLAGCAGRSAQGEIGNPSHAMHRSFLTIRKVHVMRDATM